MKVIKIEKNKKNRRSIRIKEYDYSKEGMYFVTICTQNRRKILSRIENIDNENIFVGADASVCPIKLTLIGRIVEISMKNIEKIYDNIILDKYVIMPNHIHMIIIIKEGGQDQDS